MACNYKVQYDTKYKKELEEELKVNTSATPKILKVVVSTTNKNAHADKKIVTQMVELLTMVTAQKPIVTNIKKSVAGFKIREGWPIGAKVTLRDEIMYDFLERFIKVVCPRIRDFRGLSPKSFNGGVYNLGFKDFSVFPEVELLKNDAMSIGFNISIVTSAKDSSHALSLLNKFNFPIKGE